MFFEIVLLNKGDLEMCGVVFGCPNLGEGAIGVQRVETREVAQHPQRAAQPASRPQPRTTRAKYQWCCGGETCSLGLFKAKLSRVCFTVPVIDSMPDISKSKEKGTLHCKTFTAVAPSLKKPL